jgi:hypothetical protein
MGGGGDGLSQTDINGAKKQVTDGRTTDHTGLNCNSAGDVRATVKKNHVRYTEQNTWLEVKGAKGEVKLGGFIELVLGMKHSMVGGLKTAIDLSYSNTFNIGPYTTEMLAAKYEVLHKKIERVGGEKEDLYTVCKWERNNGKWTKTVAGAKKTATPLEKEVTKAMALRCGALIELTAKKQRAKAKDVKQRIGDLKLKIDKQLNLKCSNARIKYGEFNGHIAQMQYQVGKFERKCKAMDEAVSAIMEFKGSKQWSKGKTVKLKASVLKFTASVVKLGE